MIEAMEIAKIFKEYGFNVDIADYDYEGFIDYDKYNFIFGFGEPFVKSFYGRASKIISIYYATGMSINTQNINGLKQVENFYIRKGIYLPSSARLYEKAWTIQYSLSDAIIALGNQYAGESFKKISDKKVYILHPSFIKLYNFNDIIKERNFDQAKRNFLWFASSGMIHKGLDLLLDVFKELKDLNLHICAPLNKEPEFMKLYKEELSSQNIHFYGFISLKSELFKELISKCAAVVYPSCSEGGSPSVLNVCGNGGLIPLVSKEATVDVNGFGYTFDSLDTRTIEKQILQISQSDISILKEKSVLSGKIISEQYSLNNFRDNLKSIIAEILKTAF